MDANPNPNPNPKALDTTAYYLTKAMRFGFDLIAGFKVSRWHQKTTTTTTTTAAAATTTTYRFSRGLSDWLS